ncbi:hypothetical protein MAC_09671 [Metarhizium acridum CQMa 102]|uniref:Benzoate 4-monooxygenase cytochrome P450 n=1 Tax=Metarhizium acridum (strain CQMa 102) TaxID=655827 RepID=E9EIH3_METAQ|nr:uncharacterized protein MAC_09671 [Metarhizium acridum CQMa 102]EFY84287.1 hypothetical protein MAC_09671 [Metarhizium acridum CQMa 102]
MVRIVILSIREVTSHQKLSAAGDVFRLGPNKLIFNSAAAVQDIYLNPRVAKGEPYNHGMFISKHRTLLMTTNKEEHKKKSKVIGAVLNERSMRIFEPKIIKRVNEFLQVLVSASESSTPVNLSDVSTYLATDIAADLAFGQPLNTQTEEANRFFPMTLKKWSWRVNMMMQFTPWRIYNLIMMAVKYKETMKLMVAIKNMVRAREAMDRHAYHDFYSIVIDEIKLDSSFLSSEMWPHGTNFLAAGGLTTAATIASTFFYLSRYPESYARVAREVRTTFSLADEIQQGPKLTGCKYLRACIEESLRCSPPVLSILWRQLDPADTSGKPFIVDGHVIPRGTQVGASLYALFHNDRIFPDPFVYRPERWLEPANGAKNDDLKAARRTMRMAHIPFAAGDRACPGKAMAWIEITMTIARTLWCFDFEKAPGKLGRVGEILHTKPDGQGFVPEHKIEDWFTAVHNGPYLTFRKHDRLPK